MNIDIATTIKVILVLLGIAVIVSLFMAVKSIQAGHKLPFYQKRQVLVYHGWRLVLLAAGLVLGGFLLLRVGEPVAYKFFPPSPTITPTQTVTITPTITLTPSQTYTPTITLTLAQTYTPALPEQIQATIQTPVGPNTNALFSVITFSTQIKEGVVVETQSIFSPPVSHLYGGFSYDRMDLGVQWTAVWLYGNQIVCAETKIWSYSVGGYGYTDCDRPAADWKPGDYEVQIFVGQTWKNSGRFTIKGAEVEATQSIGTPISTLLPTLTPTTPP